MKQACKIFSIENGQFLYKRQRVVVTAKQQQLEIIKDVHEGVGQSTYPKAMALINAQIQPIQKFPSASFGI